MIVWLGTGEYGTCELTTTDPEAADDDGTADCEGITIDEEATSLATSDDDADADGRPDGATDERTADAVAVTVGSLRSSNLLKKDSPSVTPLKSARVTA